MKKIMSLVVIVAILCTSIGTVSVAAIDFSAISKVTTQEAFLYSFLSDLTNDAKSDAFSKITDERFTLGTDIDVNTLDANERAYVESVSQGEKFTEMYNKEPIISFEIVYGSCVTRDDITIVKAKLFFESGAVAIVPFNVASTGNGYKIVFTLNDIEADGYKVIQADPSTTIAAEADDASTKDDGSKYSGFNWKDDYTFDYLYGTIYGIDSFSITKWVGNFDGYQANYMLSSGWESPAEVVYAVCISHWYGDDVWGSTGNAVVMNGTFDVYFQGKNNNFQNCTIRISNQTGAYPRSTGYGSFYQCSN